MRRSAVTITNSLVQGMCCLYREDGYFGGAVYPGVTAALATAHYAGIPSPIGM
jgi:hypothetical protein